MGWGETTVSELCGVERRVVGYGGWGGVVVGGG